MNISIKSAAVTAAAGVWAIAAAIVVANTFSPVPKEAPTTSVPSVATSAPTAAMPVGPVTSAVGRHACGDAIKMQLRDPESYQFVDLTLDPNNASSGVQTFRAKNGFGGYAVGQATCTRESEGTRAVLINAAQ
jgi:hypothetical protein